ncbi:MAG: hypothetical protein JRN15_12670 [Nitrososphaerota archaeon]|nr:hypothetical protein [Nitrososphaerota archaeon]
MSSVSFFSPLSESWNLPFDFEPAKPNLDTGRNATATARVAKRDFRTIRAEIEKVEDDYHRDDPELGSIQCDDPVWNGYADEVKSHFAEIAEGGVDRRD